MPRVLEGRPRNLTDPAGTGQPAVNRHRGVACRRPSVARVAEEGCGSPCLAHAVPSKIPVGRKIKFGRDQLDPPLLRQVHLALRRRPVWTAYRTETFDHLQKSQNKDGGWPGEGLSVGRVYATAWWCIILQLDKESHPAGAGTRRVLSRPAASRSTGLFMTKLEMAKRAVVPQRGVGRRYDPGRRQACPCKTGRSGAARWDREARRRRPAPVGGTKSLKMLWKTPIPGEGCSSPIVSDGRVYLTTAYEGSEPHAWDSLGRGRPSFSLAPHSSWLSCESQGRGKPLRRGPFWTRTLAGWTSADSR